MTFKVPSLCRMLSHVRRTSASGPHACSKDHVTDEIGGFVGLAEDETFG